MKATAVLRSLSLNVTQRTHAELTAMMAEGGRSKSRVLCEVGCWHLPEVLKGPLGRVYGQLVSSDKVILYYARDVGDFVLPEDRAWHFATNATRAYASPPKSGKVTVKIPPVLRDMLTMACTADPREKLGNHTRFQAISEEVRESVRAYRSVAEYFREAWVTFARKAIYPVVDFTGKTFVIKK